MRTSLTAERPTIRIDPKKTTRQKKITIEMPITNRNFLAQAEKEGMKLKKYRTPAWLKDTDFEEDNKNRPEGSGSL